VERGKTTRRIAPKKPIGRNRGRYKDRKGLEFMFEKILSKISACLNKHGLPYMIIGGQAVLLYGEPRLTRDIDVTLGANIDSLNKLLSITRELSLKSIPKDIESFVRDTMVLPTIEKSTGIRVDFIFSFTHYETQAIKRARKVSIMGQEVLFASPEDLIIHKIFAGRPRDLEDVKSVIRKNPGIDSKYIRNWLKEFEVSAEEKKDFIIIFEEILSQINS
jgi:predicted nucleotidyltransferase